MTNKVLKGIIKSLPKGKHYYIVKLHTTLDGPWSYKETMLRLEKLKDPGAYIATWDGKKWNRVDLSTMET